MDTMIISSLITLAASGTLASIGKALMVVLGLGLVIFFHELGHFAVAKWCNVHVDRFSIGIGPILWSRQKGETEYALSALPLGGYVKMLGQDDMDPNQMTSDEIAENPRSYSAKKVWQRMLIISAGVIMNVVTGFGFFAIAYNMGVREVLPVVGLAVPGSPAWKMGIQRGDRIRSINGDEIQSFNDIQQAIVLSSGKLTIEGTTLAGDDYSKEVMPEQGKQFRQIGINPARSLRISPRVGQEEPIAIPGLPADSASAPFEPGDRVAALNGVELTSWQQLSLMTARNAAEELVYAVERSSTSDAELSSQSRRVEIRIPPGPMRSIGLWMHIGPVTSIQVDSIAARAGLEEGDVIRKVDDLEVGVDIDPLRLPNYFADRAGTEVRMLVLRKKVGSTGEIDQELIIEPSDKPGWSEVPATMTAPLPIPAIGAAFRVSTRIAKVVPGSEAAGITDPGQLRPEQRITKIILPYKQDDALGDADNDAAIFELPKDSEVNWAHIFYMIQQAPLRDIEVHIDETSDSESFAVQLNRLEHEENWYLPIRGIRGFEELSEKRVAESTAEAINLGIRKTRNSTISIYMTLRSLFRRELSPNALSGPVGIVRIGFDVADSGLAQLLTFLGLLSINLAVLNFLPIPILDGGHMVFLIWEGVTRRKPSARVVGLAHGVGLLFIISLFLFVMWLDVFVRFLGFGTE